MDSKKLEEISGKADALVKRMDAMISKRADAGPSEEERMANQRAAFGFVPSKPGATGKATFERPSGKGREEMVPTGTGRSIPKSKVNSVTKSLLGWK